MHRPTIELEASMLDADRWSLAPHIVREMAEISSKEGVFTGIAWDDFYGWTILVREPLWKEPPRIAWCERNFPSEPDSDEGYEEFFLE